LSEAKSGVSGIDVRASGCAALIKFCRSPETPATQIICDPGTCAGGLMPAYA
jgi:hypothetical protein